MAARTLRSAWYLLTYQVLGWALFAAALTVAVGAATLAITIAGFPLLIAAAAVIRGCANVERARLRAVLPGPVEAHYRIANRPGLIASAAVRWKDPATWRDIAYLAGLFVPLVIFGGVVLVVWLVIVAGVAIPLWYWAPVAHYAHGLTVHGVQLGYFPNGPSGHGAEGIYIQSLPVALLCALVCAILLIPASMLLVVTARAHATVARGLLRAPRDPLAEARLTLARPGPLPALISQNASS
jgi:hypothetical protein